VAVGIERQANLRVAEGLHDRAWVNTLGEQQRRGGVAQIMKSNGRKLGRRERRVELTRGVSRIQCRSKRGGKDQPGLLPRATSRETLLSLL